MNYSEMTAVELLKKYCSEETSNEERNGILDYCKNNSTEFYPSELFTPAFDFDSALQKLVNAELKELNISGEVTLSDEETVDIAEAVNCDIELESDVKLIFFNEAFTDSERKFDVEVAGSSEGSEYEELHKRYEEVLNKLNEIYAKLCLSSYVFA